MFSSMAVFSVEAIVAIWLFFKINLAEIANGSEKSETSHKWESYHRF